MKTTSSFMLVAIAMAGCLYIQGCGMNKTPAEVAPELKGLPQVTQEFIIKYFPELKVQSIQRDKEDGSYEVRFADGSEVEFNRAGNWTSVECKKVQIPAGLIPRKITSYLDEHQKGVGIKKLERGTKYYEVHLKNWKSIKFDLDQNLVSIDD